MYKIKRFSRFTEIDYNEDLLKTYPKLRDLSKVIRNQDKIHKLNQELDRTRVYVDSQVLMSPFYYDEAEIDSSGRIQVLYGNDVTSLFYDTDSGSFVMVTESSGLFSKRKEKDTTVKEFCNYIIGSLEDLSEDQYELDLDDDTVKDARRIYKEFRKLI